MTPSRDSEKKEASFQENFLNYVKWTLQMDKLTHESLMDYGRWKGKDNLGRVSFMIAQRALDWCLEDASPDPLQK